MDNPLPRRMPPPEWTPTSEWTQKFLQGVQAYGKEFSYSDLRSCMLVCKEWKIAFSAVAQRRVKHYLEKLSECSEGKRDYFFSAWTAFVRAETKLKGRPQRELIRFLKFARINAGFKDKTFLLNLLTAQGILDCKQDDSARTSLMEDISSRIGFDLPSKVRTENINLFYFYFAYLRHIKCETAHGASTLTAPWHLWNIEAIKDSPIITEEVKINFRLAYILNENCEKVAENTLVLKNFNQTLSRIIGSLRLFFNKEDKTAYKESIGLLTLYIKYQKWRCGSRALNNLILLIRVKISEITGEHEIDKFFTAEMDLLLKSFSS